jgi:electron transfer flavoprotein alpha subunit
MKALVLAETANQYPTEATLRTITAAQQLAEVSVWLIGFECEKAAQQLTRVAGVGRVLYTDDAVYEHGLAENMSSLITELGPNYDYILAPATPYYKNILPRVAALLDVSQISEVMAIINDHTFMRPMYAGHVQARVSTTEAIKVMTIRPTAFAKAELTTAAAPLEHYQRKIANNQVIWLNERQDDSDRPNLADAKVVIGGGRGLAKAENFALLESIAQRLNAAIGATRAAVDAGFVGNELQIGQTGHIIAPQLYIAVGISGAVQHLAGIKESHTIVAINCDETAPIFEVADYALVGDLFEILPQLDALLEQLGYNK